MVYQPLIPLPTDLLSTSQGDIKTNFTAANTIFGVDHYAFDNATASKGFHNTVTTPLIVGAAHPAAATEAVFYAMQPTANVGLLHFSKAPATNSPAPIPSIVTTRQSGPVAISLLKNQGSFGNVLNVAGLARLCCLLSVSNYLATRDHCLFFISWDSGTTTFLFTPLVPGSKFTVTNSGTTFRLSNTSTTTDYTQVFWTLQFFRLET